MLPKSLPTGIAETPASRARRMEIVGHLTGGVMHDFNNILSVISGTIDILAEAVADRPDLAAIAGLIEEAATRGAALASNLLVLARGQPSRLRDVDVVSVLADAARLLRPAMGAQIEIDFRPAAEVPPALADPGQLMAAIISLAILAREAMPQGGRIGFEAQRAAAGDGGAGFAAEHFVMVTVTARSRGTVADVPQGILRDLGMIGDFINRCGGHIEPGRQGDRGTSVRIYLPQAADAVQSSAADHGERSAAAPL
jgi:signal transduction histidine kinase